MHIDEDRVLAFHNFPSENDVRYAARLCACMCLCLCLSISLCEYDVSIEHAANLIYTWQSVCRECLRCSLLCRMPLLWSISSFGIRCMWCLWHHPTVHWPLCASLVEQRLVSLTILFHLNIYHISYLKAAQPTNTHKHKWQGKNCVLVILCGGKFPANLIWKWITKKKKKLIEFVVAIVWTTDKRAHQASITLSSYDKLTNKWKWQCLQRWIDSNTYSTHSAHTQANPMRYYKVVGRNTYFYLPSHSRSSFARALCAATKKKHKRQRFLPNKNL